MLKLSHLFKRPNSDTARRAVADDITIAEASETVRVEGNHYFPPQSVDWSLLEESDATSVCFWKGVASYYDIVVDGRRYPSAAWTYKTPSDAAGHIKDHVAFWRGVRVVKA